MLSAVLSPHTSSARGRPPNQPASQAPHLVLEALDRGLEGSLRRWSGRGRRACGGGLQHAW